MDMKLNGRKLRALRLERSWSQERLAEAAGLNPRTVQRAESEDSASLRTRLQLAEALRVLPAELDPSDESTDDRKVERQTAAPPPAVTPLSLAGLLAWMKYSIRDTSIYYVIVLALVSLTYLGSAPIYFSLSLSNYSWVNTSLGRPLQEIPAWWVMTLSLWAALSLPILILLYRKRNSLFVPYLLAFSAGLVLTVLKSWNSFPWRQAMQTAAVAELLTFVLYLSGLLLLLSLYVPWLNTAKMRHAVGMCLSAYLFIWFFQSFGLNALLVFLGVTQFAQEFPGLSSIFFVLKPLAANLVQLVPLALVLLLSLRGKDHGSAPEDRATVETAQGMLVTAGQH